MHYEIFLLSDLNVHRHIEEFPKDLQDDIFEAHKVFDLIVYLAILVFFRSIFHEDVMKSASRLYNACSPHAGLLVLYWYAFLHGQNICAWWTAQRSNDGGKVPLIIALRMS